MELAIGQRLTLTIEDLAFGGEGVARAGDFVLFVPFVIPGEEVEVEVLELKKRFGHARLLRVLRPAADRVAPSCPYYGQCGGCQYQHLAYEAQLTLKWKQITDIFERIGHFATPPIAPVVRCPSPYGYRNRIMIRSQWNKVQQRLHLGFLRAQDRLVVDVEECRIAEPALNELLREARRHPPARGGLKVLLRLPIPGWEVPQDSFFQNNSILLPELVRQVRECLQHAGVRFLLDAYCGVGFFSIEAAADVEAFVGVEYDRRAIEAAKHNASARHLRHGKYYCGKTEDSLPKLFDQYPPSASAVILDPPRTGCRREVVELLRELRVAQVIYISCNPSTQARDLNILCQNDVYALMKVTPVDMFPQTQHVECVADVRLNQH